MKTIDDLDISELMRIINYQMSENQQLKNDLAELQVLYKKLLEENRVLEIEKHRLFQERNNLKCLKKQNEELRIAQNHLKMQIRSLEIKREKKCLN